MSGLGASISTTLFGQIVGNFGPAAAFLSIAAVSIAAVLLLWLLMPETSTLADDRRDSSTVQTRDVE
jgi:predicted MFS family arabinose efflux permease